MIQIAVAFLVFFAGSPFAFAGPLHDAARDGDVDKVRALIAEGAAIDAQSDRGETPLIVAVLEGHAAVAQLLITNGADVMARNERGLTPLHAAAYSGDAKLAGFLLDHGAALEDRGNISGAAPLMLAAEGNRLAVAELLIARGADVSIPDREGATPLTQAWSKQQTEMVRLLKQHGATCQPVEFLGSEDYHRRCVEAGK